MKKFKPVLLAAVLVLSMALLAGCGGKAKEEDKFIGTWETSIEMANYLNEAISALNTQLGGDYLTVDTFAITMNFTFNEDGTYSISADADSVTQAMEGFKGVLSDGMTKYLEDVIAASGQDMTPDEAMQQSSGMTMQEFIDQTAADFDMDSMVDETTTEGNWKVKDGKLFLSDGKDYEVDENIYDTYEFDGDNLKLLESVGGEEDDMLAELYPVTLTKKQ